MSATHLDAPRQLQDMFLYRISRLLSTASVPVLRECEQVHGITRREWRVLAHLAQAEGCLSSELADLAQLDRVRTSRALSILVDKGLVRRAPRPGDRRLVELALTDAGRALHAALLPKVARLNRALLAGLSAAQLRQLEEVLEHLQQRAESLRGDGP